MQSRGSPPIKCETKLRVFNLPRHIRRFTTSFLLVVSLAFLGCVVMPQIEYDCGLVIRKAKPKSGFMMVVGSDGKASIRSGLLREVPFVPFILGQSLTAMPQLRWVEFQKVVPEIPPSSAPLQKVRGRAPPVMGLC